MKVKKLLFSVIVSCALFSFMSLNAQNNFKQNTTYVQGPPQRTCGTETPSQQWEDLLQQKIAEFLAANPDFGNNAKQGSGNSTQAVYTIPVIIHVIHGGQAVGTFPNLFQGQLTSQIQVLNDDFAGVGYNIGNYPVNAFTAWATNTTIAAASKDALGRIKIANTGVTFCLALTDTIGNTLAEPGIHRVDYNTLPALTGTFTSKNPAAAVYNTSGKFQGFINGYIKPNTIWNVSKYMNLWVTDEQAAVGLLGYATFPPISTLTGIPGGVGTATSDGFWSWAASFGSKVIFPGGTYATGYDLGRTCTHEIGHWVGLRHIWGDGTCATDYCNDTPPASAANFVNCPTTYPYKSGSCAGPPSNAPNGEMFQNFMDYSYDCAMFMFTEDQRTRLQIAMANSPYRKFLGTHGLCSVPPPVANFSFSPNPACIGQTVSIVDMSTGSPGAWSYTITGATPATSTLQSPFVTYAAAGVYSITLIASNGGGPSAPVVKTITISAAPVVTVTASPSTVCAGNSSTITATGASTYSWSTGATTSVIVVTPTINTTYTVTGANGSCTNTKTVSVTISGSPTVNIAPASATICAGNTTTFTGSGATNYTWMPGSITTATISVNPTSTTIYTLTGTNAAGCASTRTAQVTVNTTPTVNVVASPTAICSGNSATITASGAATYSWNTGATTAAIVVTPTATANYTVTGTNGTCSDTKTISLIVSSTPTVNIAPASATICTGNTTTFTGSGATNYTWMPGSITTATISVNPTSTTIYTLTGTNAAGCASTRTAQVTVNTTPTVNVVASPTAICSGNSATITASGAATYSWNTGATTAAIVVTPTATANYTVTGTNGTCSDTKTISLIINPSPTLNINPPSATICIGNSATFFGSGATTYTWMPGSITNASINVSPTITTTYTLTGTNAGCTSTRTTQVVVNALPTVTINSNPLTICPGSSATLTASGSGPGPFTYVWSTGATIASISSSIAGVYSTTVTNGNGCSGSQSYTLNAAAGLTISIAATPTAICSGGSATLSASGASTFTWNTGPTTSSIVVSPTIATTYTVNGTSGSCTGSQTISIVVNANPTVAVVANPTLVCAGSTSTLTATGAATYSWSTGATTAIIAVTPSVNTTYTVTGLNPAGCSNTKTISVNTQASPIISVSANPVSICPGGTSTLTAAGSGPPGPFTYLWSNGATTAVTTTSITGVYTATFTNGNGCTASQAVTITAAPSVSITVIATPTSVCSGSSATITASGASTYTWSTGPTTSSIVISPTTTTTYTVNGTSGSCTGSKTISLVVNTNPTVTVIATPTAICSGSSSTITASGATTYSWNTGATTAAITASPGITTTYTVTGANGTCTNTKTVSLVVNLSPTINVIASPTAICSGNSTTITASGATTYSWNTGATTAAITVSPSTTTAYTVIGSNGSCINTKTISVTVNILPTVAVVASPTAICAGATASLIATGATTYSWSTGGTGTSISVTPSVTSTYSVTGSNGACSNTKTVSIVVNAAPTVSVTTSTSVICVGQSATLTSSGATSYTYNPGAITVNPAVVSPTSTTTYIVTGNNAAGCTGNANITQVVSPCTGINNSAIVNSTFGVYPNPNNGEFTVTIELLSENTFVEIYNGIGQIINKQMIKENATKINLTEQADGIYHVRITSEGKQLYKAKVIKD